MRKIIFILIAISCFACSKSNEEIPDFYLGASFDFSVFNAQNEDLLNPATTDHFEATEIKVFYVIDGEVIEIYDPSNVEAPRKFVIYKHENEYRMQVYLNFSDTSEKPITYVQWRNNDTDTIEAIFERIDGNITKRKVWLNDQEIWDWSTNENEYFKIIK